MPGGLTRFLPAASAEDHVGVDAKRGGSKDTWVLGWGPVSTSSLLPPGTASGVSRPGSDLASRVADNCTAGTLCRGGRGTTRLLARHPVGSLRNRAGTTCRIADSAAGFDATCVILPSFVGEERANASPPPRKSCYR